MKHLIHYSSMFVIFIYHTYHLLTAGTAVNLRGETGNTPATLENLKMKMNET